MITNAPYHMSGAAKQMLRLADNLRKKGTRIETSSLYGSFHALKVTSLIRQFNALPLADIKQLIRLMMICQKKRPSIVHFHFFGSLVLIASELLRKQNVQVISKISMLDGDDPAHLFSRRRFKTIYRNILGNKNNLTLVCTTKKMFDRTTEYLERVPDIKVEYIPNGVDTKTFEPYTAKSEAKSLIGIPDKTDVIIVIGAVTHRKGADLAVASLGEVVKVHPETKLIFVGTKKWERFKTHKAVPRNRFVLEVQKYAKERNFGQNIMFTGKISDVLPYINAADIFLLPSRKEGMPNGLLEAMSSGLPTVTSDLSGAAYDAVSDGESGFITSLDSDEISDKICFLIENPEERYRMGRCARQIVLQNFDMEYVSSRYINLYDELLTKNKK